MEKIEMMKKRKVKKNQQFKNIYIRKNNLIRIQYYMYLSIFCCIKYIKNNMLNKI